MINEIIKYIDEFYKETTLKPTFCFISPNNYIKLKPTLEIQEVILIPSDDCSDVALKLDRLDTPGRWYFLNLNKTTTPTGQCNHKWKITKGFRQDYYDCELCSKKKEDFC